MNTLPRLRKLLATSFGIREESITPESTLGELFRQQTQITPDVEESTFDSLALVELVMHLEDEFGIGIPDTELPSLPPLLFTADTTVRQIANCMDKWAAGS
jgi:acyl carrier protein